jgi:hypothetical protein
MPNKIYGDLSVWLERWKQVHTLRAEGHTLQWIGDHMEPPVTRERVRQLLQRKEPPKYKPRRPPQDPHAPRRTSEFCIVCGEPTQGGNLYCAARYQACSSYASALGEEEACRRTLAGERSPNYGGHNRKDKADARARV